MIKFLLGYGANPDYNSKLTYDADWDAATSSATFAGQTILTCVSQDDRYELVPILLEAGTDPRMPRQDTKSAKEIALEIKHKRVAELIESYLRQSQTAQ